MKTIYLQCQLMDNNEIMFNGRSLGFFKDEEIKKYAKRKRIPHVTLDVQSASGKIKSKGLGK